MPGGERGQDRPSLTLQKHLRDLSWDENGTPASWLLSSVKSCPAPRALSRMPNLVLLALSKPAIRKRPSMVDWIGRDLTRIASGVLAEMLDDRVLQRSIASGEIACVEATTRSALRSAESETIGAFSTTITYFFHEDVLYSDALSVPADPAAPRLATGRCRWTNSSASDRGLTSFQIRGSANSTLLPAGSRK